MSKRTLRNAVPVVLTIAGSDNSGGAGVQADIKTFTTLRVFGTSAVTCVVAEHPGRVLSISPLAPARVAEQIQLVLEAFPLAAIKTGMLHSAAIIRAVARAIEPALRSGVPLVVDPVMTAGSGRTLLEKNALRALTELMRQATLITPNRDETAILSGTSFTSLAELEAAAVHLAREFAGPAVLAKGGHLDSPQAIDVLVTPDGKLRRFSARRIRGIDPHGTGCTYSAAIAASLAQGLPLADAVASGKKFLTRALRSRFQLGEYQLLNHFHQP